MSANTDPDEMGCCFKLEDSVDDLYLLAQGFASIPGLPYAIGGDRSMTAAKEQIEYELNVFFASALGDVFKSCRLAESVLDYQISTVSFPTEKNAWLELGELPVIIELSNGRRFEISASEWLQITPL